MRSFLRLAQSAAIAGIEYWSLNIALRYEGFGAKRVGALHFTTSGSSERSSANDLARSVIDAVQVLCGYWCCQGERWFRPDAATLFQKPGDTRDVILKKY